MIVTCQKCSGKGKVPLGEGTNVTTLCPACRGDKQLDIPYGKRLCPDCLGAKKGTITVAGLTFKDEPCKTCNATGFMDA